jgi:hypothetical protein
MQISKLPTGLDAADEAENEGLERLDPDILLITDYLGRELSEQDRLAVEARLETDTAFYVKMKPYIDIWREPVNWRELLEEYEAAVPDPEARKREAEQQKGEEHGEDDPDFAVIREWLMCRLPPHHEKAVDDRLVSDEAFWEKVIPVMKMWTARNEFLDRMGPEIGDGPVDEADPDVVLFRDYLAFKLSRAEMGDVDRRLGRDEAFARKVAPMWRTWGCRGGWCRPSVAGCRVRHRQLPH